MSQQGFTIVSLSQIEVLDVGDLEFIQGKVLAGNYFQVTGNINNVNDTIEFIVPNGKTAFLIEAKIVSASTLPVPLGGNSGTDQITAELKIDAVTKDTAQFQLAFGTLFVPPNSGGAGYGNAMNEFQVKGLSLVGDGIKKIEIENIEMASIVRATMSGYLIDT